MMPAIRIANGQLFDPWNPEMRFISTEGSWNWLGHHLANECRYGGGCKWFYSVAQHSVLASRLIVPYWRKLRLAALLHDIAEGGGLRDLPKPIKDMFPDYIKVENNLLEWFYKQFGILEYLNAPQIKEIDKELLDAERFKLFPGSGYQYSGSICVEPWDREYARDEFNKTLRSLTASGGSTRPRLDLTKSRRNTR